MGTAMSRAEGAARLTVWLGVALAAYGLGAETTSKQPEEREPQGLRPLCTGKEDPKPCWLALENRPGCHFWNSRYGSARSATFSGSADCPEGKLSGTGAITWRLYEDSRPKDVVEDVGPYVAGRKHGRWTLTQPDGSRHEGPYEHGKRHGHWTIAQGDGHRGEGPYLDGKKHGRWIEHRPDGARAEGPYADGRRHGRWVVTSTEGHVQEGSFADGAEHGHFRLVFANGDSAEGPLVRGERHGRWVYFKKADDLTWKVYYRHGERHEPDPIELPVDD